MTNKAFFFGFLGIMLVSLLSCATTTIDVVPVTPYQATIRRCAIGTIRLESIYSYANDQQELKSIIVSAGKEHGFLITDRATDFTSADICTMHFLLREKSYVRGFETVITTAILAEVHSPEGDILYRISWLHDGEESLTSLVYLREALSGLFESLSAQAAGPDPQDS